ncbi:NfeD family protein [Hwanghaeella grinnelliae]|uniref:NfeD family protein n=1 Tax=Hwanghaeella grinnelliae TaxID=2500179 RepID=A0A437QW72_9PROT|nr:NfeD family protein [Hwanghaeella grinnelliae]RVU38673.1 NfeD family protein [Hwanghaeella grinnelliae]
MEWLDQIEFWWWWALGLGLLALEIVVPGTFFMWMSVASAAVGALLLIHPGIDWEYQMLIFAVISVVSIAGFRYWQQRHPTESSDEMLNRRGAHYIGRTVIVLDAFVNGQGRVKLEDSSWSARSTDGSDFIAGAKARVTEVEGSTLIVEVAS